MALQDVSRYMIDPDFMDAVTIIRRTAQSVDQYGRSSYTETSIQAYMSVQGTREERLNRESDSAWLTNAIDVYYAGVLFAESQGGYADVVIWRNKRYQVEAVVDNYSNYGAGWTHAMCRLEDVNND